MVGDRGLAYLQSINDTRAHLLRIAGEEDAGVDVIPIDDSDQAHGADFCRPSRFLSFISFVKLRRYDILVTRVGNMAMSLVKVDRLTTALLAEHKVAEQERLIARMLPDDPQLPEALSLLHHMRQNVSAARFVDALRTAQI